MQVQTAIRTYIIRDIRVNVELKQECPHHLSVSMGSSKEQWTETILLWDDEQIAHPYLQHSRAKPAIMQLTRKMFTCHCPPLPHYVSMYIQYIRSD